MHFSQNRALKWKRRVWKLSGWACLALGGILVLAVAALGLGQNPSTTAPSTPPRSTSIINPAANRTPDANEVMLMRQARAKRVNFDAANAERLKQMTQAAEMLETLAMALKADVDKAQSGDFSANDLSKAENIEKLAHIVKDRMKLTIAPN